MPALTAAPGRLSCWPPTDPGVAVTTAAGKRQQVGADAWQSSEAGSQLHCLEPCAKRSHSLSCGADHAQRAVICPRDSQLPPYLVTKGEVQSLSAKSLYAKVTWHSLLGQPNIGQSATCCGACHVLGT